MDDQLENDGRLRELALFAGAGGGILGGRLLGWRTVCAVERDPYAASVLVARQNDGSLEPFPIWDDVCTFDGRPWRGCVDVVSGGFPCQDISVAGTGAGIDAERSGLWKEMARIIREVRPPHVFVENSPALTSRGLCRVLGDLAEMGYDAEWGVLGADAPAVAFGCALPAVAHNRDRIWIVGRLRASTDAHRNRQPQQKGRVAQERGRAGDLRGACADADGVHVEGELLRVAPAEGWPIEGAGPTGPLHLRTDWWHTEPDVGRVDHGVAHRVDRLRALGNGQVPAVAALAWRELTARIEHNGGAEENQ